MSFNPQIVILPTIAYFRIDAVTASLCEDVARLWPLSLLLVLLLPLASVDDSEFCFLLLLLFES